MTKDNFNFWAVFDNLCVSLRQADKKAIADDLKEAQKYATGMTDGWHDFLNAFEKVVKDNETVLNKEEKSIADDLIFKLKKSLKDR